MSAGHTGEPVEARWGAEAQTFRSRILQGSSSKCKRAKEKANGGNGKEQGAGPSFYLQSKSKCKRWASSLHWLHCYLWFIHNQVRCFMFYLVLFGFVGIVWCVFRARSVLERVFCYVGPIVDLKVAFFLLTCGQACG